jgi:TrmH family RNA methyltransferase
VDPASIDVVLVRPSRLANVAAACRAMKNMGLRRLKLVLPLPAAEEKDARNLAYGAWDVLDAATRHERLVEAVGESTLVVGTSGRADPSAWSPRRLAAEGGAWARGGRVSLVFGPEATGLRNDELDLCHLRVRIPTDSAHPSLNLAQAVLILAYELRLAALGPEGPARDLPVAPAGDVEAAVQDLREALLGVGYLNPQNPEAILAELRHLLVRARPSPREVDLVRGLARQVRWAVGSIARDRNWSG